MKYIRILLFTLLFAPIAAFAQNNEFMVAAQLLSAAKNADIQQVQILINSGADVNYVDRTGLSLVCTALMNNDVRAAQILQMYGADASQCDKQIKQYRSKTKTRGTVVDGGGGLFSGLSSAQSLALTAAGAAVVVGGLFLLTDVLDSDNGNDNGAAGGGNRPSGGGDSGDGGATGGNLIPIGPAYFTADGKIAYSTQAYQNNLSQWNPVSNNEGLRSRDFNFFRPDIKVPNPDGSEGTVTNPNSYKTAGITLPMQNYLLMMHGYSSFANGYMGQATFRDSKNNPVRLLNDAGGGVPVSVAMITANGINPVGSAGRGKGILYASSANADSATSRVDKYLNYNAPTDNGNTLGSEISGFDLSGAGTAMNPFVSANDNALGKIIAGWEGARPDEGGAGDLYGFVPNGRLGVYVTGGGMGFKQLETPTEMGTISKVAGGTANTLQVGDTITADGKTYKIVSATDSSVTNPTVTINGKTFNVAPGSSMLVAKCESVAGGDCTGVSDMAIYMGTDNFYYMNYSGGNHPDAVFSVADDKLMLQKEYVATDIKNYQAMTSAIAKANEMIDSGTGRSSLTVVANTSINPKSRDIDYYKMSDMPALIALAGTAPDAFINAVNKYYEVDSTDNTTQGAYANALFGTYSNRRPIIVNPAGEFKFGTGEGMSPSVLDATFENYAPLIYKNLEHMFMTVVAVQHVNDKGTEGADSIGAYGNGTAYGPLYLSSWQDGTDGPIYQSRKCGVAGLGLNGIDPWCFAAAGPTIEMATASAAGAVAALRGAFYYMENDQIFALMALTADGAYLGTNPNTGQSWNTTELVAYLKSMYSLPPEYRADDTLAGADYLRAFREVYGYGLINLERAMTPGKKIYYYNGNDIVSAAGNAYWRAASNTTFRASAAFAPRVSKISAPFFDILESVDGELSMPRVWKNEFEIGSADRRGLYMGDVLGEFKTRNVAPARTQIGNIGFSMATSGRAYDDNLGGLDAMRFDYNIGNWGLAAGYQRHMTDGASRFVGMHNPIFGLASNAVMSDANYNMGRWSFGARAFSGTITDETLLENDPTLSARFEPAHLGRISGAAGDVAFLGDKFAFNASIGNARESDTILGAQTGGLLNLGAGDTTYVDAEMRYKLRDDVSFMMRSTFARTAANATGEFILGMSDVESDAFAIGADIGNFSFAISRPLGVNRGKMQYAHAEYDIVNGENGKYELAVRDMHVADIDLSPAYRELRFSGEYRHNFGEFTDGAIGFIYRVNPNHTSDFGNESIFMLKMTHRLGI